MHLNWFSIVEDGALVVEEDAGGEDLQGESGVEGAGKNAGVL